MILKVIKYIVAFTVLTAIGLYLIESVFLPLYVGYNNEHYLPDLRGKYLETTQRDLVKMGFRTEIIKKDYSPGETPGTIINMSPAPFIKVKEGRTVKLTVAGEKAEVVIPEFVDVSLRSALLQMQSAGLELDTVMEEYNSDFEGGVITYQSPRSGQLVNAGAKLTFMVSKGPPPDIYRVPDLVNLSLGKATAAAAEAGLRLGDVTEEYHPELIPNTVIDQNLTAGMRLSIPARIDLVVSTDKLK